jgi:drug/metabolite transporter (DMT)-like permease
MFTINKSLSWSLAGFLFAVLWASASTATKIGLTVAQPFVIAEVRFAMASAILLFISHGIMKHRLPHKKEWLPLAVCGFCNITVYLGLYVIAMQTVSAGIGAMAVATTPVFIAFLSVFILRKKLRAYVIVSIIICSLGVVCASWPLLGNATVKAEGLVLLLVSMVCSAFGNIYFSSRKWNGLSLLTINGWQTLLGGLFLLPPTLIMYTDSGNQWNSTFWSSVIWLAIPVSIVAVQLWLWLLQVHAVRAGLWLYLCPLFGLMMAALLMKDSINAYTVAGIALVMGGLFFSNLKKGRNEVLLD